MTDPSLPAAERHRLASIDAAEFRASRDKFMAESGYAENAE